MDYSSSSDDEASLFLLEQRMRISQASHNLMRQTIMVLDTLHPQHGGLSSGRRYIDQDREADHLQLMKDYFFGTNSTYNEDLFRRCYRMRRSLFTKILNDVTNFDTYFMRRKNATGKWGASPHQKMTLVMRMLTYGILVDAADEYSRLGKSTIIESFQHFIRAIPQIYGATYLRSPTKDDLTRLLCKASQKGFPGMLGSLDCMHWQWKNYPTVFQGAYVGHCHSLTIILEAVASYDTWIWHANFGFPGSFNDISVLDCSHLFDSEVQGCNPIVKYTVIGQRYKVGYYLADGIYLKWATLVQTISNPQTLKGKLFVRLQEAYRKDIERAFRILQARWAIIKQPTRGWDANDLHYIMKTCIILHNMIVDDERPDDPIDESDDESDHEDRFRRAVSCYDGVEETPSSQSVLTLEERFARQHLIRSSTIHARLKHDLMEHVWNLFGETNNNL